MRCSHCSDQGLDDISASRSRFSWGVPFPRQSSDGETQTTYVWFDALPNYLTATGYPAPEYRKRWPADVHIVGKDITRFHSVIWPAMLMSAGVELPRHVWAHGFVMLGGDRFSKSAGVQLDMDEAINRFGPDAFRYFLLREVPFDADGNFSLGSDSGQYNSDLAEVIKNSFANERFPWWKYRGGVVPSSSGRMLDDSGDSSRPPFTIKSCPASQGIVLRTHSEVWKCVAHGNEFVGRQAPWKMAKDPALNAELDATLSTLIRSLARRTVALALSCPAKPPELFEALGAPGGKCTICGSTCSRHSTLQVARQRNPMLYFQGSALTRAEPVLYR